MELQLMEQVVGLVVTAGGAAWGAWRTVVRPRLVQPARAFFGRVESAVALVESELRANGGGSIKDEVRALTAQTQAITHMFSHPVFETDSDGHYIRVNRAYRDLLGYGHEDLVGMGWVHVVHAQDRERVVTEWAHAVADRRMCTIDARLVTRDGETMGVRLNAEPVRAKGGVLLGWFGTLTVQEGR